MRVTILPLALIAALVAASACQDDRQTTFTAPVLESASSIAANGQNAAVPLSGDEEVPAVATRARGTRGRVTFLVVRFVDRYASR